MFFAGVFGGRRATNSIASSLVKVPRGCSSSIVILPVLSSVSIPEMPPLFVLANCSAPTMSS